MAKTTASAKKVHVHGSPAKPRNSPAKRSAYDPEAHVIPGRPKPGKKPSDYCGIWRRNRSELD